MVKLLPEVDLLPITIQKNIQEVNKLMYLHTNPMKLFTQNKQDVMKRFLTRDGISYKVGKPHEVIKLFMKHCYDKWELKTIADIGQTYNCVCHTPIKIQCHMTSTRDKSKVIIGSDCVRLFGDEVLTLKRGLDMIRSKSPAQISKLPTLFQGANDFVTLHNLRERAKSTVSHEYDPYYTKPTKKWSVLYRRSADDIMVSLDGEESEPYSDIFTPFNGAVCEAERLIPSQVKSMGFVDDANLALSITPKYKGELIRSIVQNHKSYALFMVQEYYAQHEIYQYWLDKLGVKQ